MKVRAPPVVIQTSPYQSQHERLEKGNKPHSSTLRDQTQSSSKSQVNDKINTAMLGGKFDRELENISKRIFG